MDITFIDSRDKNCQEMALHIPDNSLIIDVLMRENIDINTPLLLGIWGKKVTPETRLKNQDRLEIYAPLICDPNTARQQRAINKRKGEPTYSPK